MRYKYIIIPDDCDVLDSLPMKQTDSLGLLINVVLPAIQCEESKIYIEMAIRWLEALDGIKLNTEQEHKYRRIFRNFIQKWRDMLANRYVVLDPNCVWEFQYRDKNGSFVFKNIGIKTWKHGKNRSIENLYRKCSNR